MTLQLLHSEFPYTYMRKILFYFLSVQFLGCKKYVVAGDIHCKQMGQKLSCIDSAREEKRYKHFYIKINNLNLSSKILSLEIRGLNQREWKKNRGKIVFVYPFSEVAGL